MISSKNVIKDLLKLKNPEKAKILQRFFKTKKGEYGEGDVFWGIVVPLQRQVAKLHKDEPLSEIQKLLESKIHEHGLTALFILVAQFKKADEKNKRTIFDLYLSNIKNINNWDLVDLSAPNVVGEYLYFYGRERSRPFPTNNVVTGHCPVTTSKVFERLPMSSNLWSRRIAILATFSFIRQGEYQIPLDLYESVLEDKEDLIHKAVGWMLREIGKRNLVEEVKFLDKHYREMPRTMLRYSIEKFDEITRQKYLKNKQVVSLRTREKRG